MARWSAATNSASSAAMSSRESRSVCGTVPCSSAFHAATTVSHIGLTSTPGSIVAKESRKALLTAARAAARFPTAARLASATSTSEKSALRAKNALHKRLGFRFNGTGAKRGGERTLSEPFSGPCDKLSSPAQPESWPPPAGGAIPT